MNTAFRSNRERDPRHWDDPVERTWDGDRTWDVERTWDGDRRRSSGNTGRAYTPDYERPHWFRDSPEGYCTDPHRDLRLDPAPKRYPMVRDRDPPMRDSVRDRGLLRDRYPHGARDPENETVWGNVRDLRDYSPRRDVKIPMEHGAHSSREKVLEVGHRQNHRKPYFEEDLEVGHRPNHHKPYSEEAHGSQGFQRFVNLLNKGVDINQMSNIVNGISARGRELERPALLYRSESQESHSEASHKDHSRSQSGERWMDATRSNNRRSSLPSNERTGGRFGSRSTRSRSPAPVTVAPDDKQKYGQMQSLLQTIGLDLGVEEVGKLTGRIQERLYGKKETERRGNKVNNATTTTPSTSTPASPIPPMYPPGPPPGFYAPPAASSHSYTYHQPPATYPPYPPPPLLQGTGLQGPLVNQYRVISQPTRWLQPIPQATSAAPAEVPLASGCNSGRYLREIPKVTRPTTATTLKGIPKKLQKKTRRGGDYGIVPKQNVLELHEGRSGFRTIQIIGLPESVEGTCPYQFISGFLVKLLHLSFDSFWCHPFRTPSVKPPPGEPPRTVIVCFKNTRDRDRVMRMVPQTRDLFYEGHPIQILEDFSPEVQEQRAECRSLMYELFKHGFQPTLESTHHRPGDQPTDPSKLMITKPSGEKEWLSASEARELLSKVQIFTNRSVNQYGQKSSM